LKKQLFLLNKEKAISFLSKTKGNNKICYYLSYDNDYLINLRDKVPNHIEINNLSGMFDEALQEIKEPYLELMGQINKKFDSLEWWGSVIASKNSESTPLLKYIVYLFCAKRILTDNDSDVIFIVDSQALSGCISIIASNLDFHVINRRSKLNIYLQLFRNWVWHLLKILYFFITVIQDRIYAFKYLKPLSPTIPKKYKKRVIIRSWVTEGNFDENNRFHDRNFGMLPGWLKSKDYDVWIMPTLFNLSMSRKELYSILKFQKQKYLFLHHYLTISDYYQALKSSINIIKNRVDNMEILNINVSPIINEVIQTNGFDISLCISNLCYNMLRRLSEKGTDIHYFYYAFECNPTEKQFILGCRKYFPDSNIYGYQHTTFFPNQLAYHFSKEEINFHPFPDKIICSGPIYLKLFEEAGFPPEMLVLGGNLRFTSVYKKSTNKNLYKLKEKRNILLPLTFSYSLALDLFLKVKDLLEDISIYNIWIRNHPLLLKKKITVMLEKVGIENYNFLDDGIIQDWLPQINVLISNGGSITIVEAVVMGTPIIRVIPDQDIFYDPFHWPDYPLPPVNKIPEIQDQLSLIDKMVNINSNTFTNIGKEVKEAYFTKPNEENLKVFL